MSTIDIMRDLEQRRKSIQFKTILPMALFLVFFFGFQFFATNLAIVSMMPLLMMGMMVALVIFSYQASKERKEFKRIYKENFVVGALKEILGDVQYNPMFGFSELDVARTGVVQMGNRFSSEDYIEGYWDGVHFRQSDVVVKRVTGSGKNRHTYVHFSGRLFEFDCPQEDNVSTLLFSKNYQYPGHGLGMRYEKVHMENEQFNKRFKIKAAREIDAFYILTPHMMECVDNILMKAKSVGMHFANGKLYLGINYGGKSAFDANMNKPLVYADEVAKIKADTRVIIDIVKTLKLDQNARQDQIRNYGGIVDPIAELKQEASQPAEERTYFNQQPAESKFGFTLKQ